MTIVADTGRTSTEGVALVADVGGTHCRFARVREDGSVAPLVRFGTAEVDGPLDAVARARTLLDGAPLRSLALAIAAPLTGDRVEMVNAGWRFSCAELAASLGATVVAMNDFVAQSYALACVEPDALVPVGPSLPARRAPKVVLGPGTGLGVGLLVPRDGGWDALPSEGGHATAAPSDTEEAELFARAWAVHPHLSWERLVSGPGLELLHTLVAERDGCVPTTLTAAEITRVPRSATSQEAIRRFVALLATAASNVALTVNAFGGVHLVGGVLDHLDDGFDAAAFRARFEAKGRYASLLATIPVYRVRDALAPLRGAAYAARRVGDGHAPSGVMVRGDERR